MRFYVYTIERDGKDTMAGFFIDSVPVPMVCDERQVEKLDGYAKRMSDEHGVTVKRQLMDTKTTSDIPKLWAPIVSEPKLSEPEPKNLEE